MSRLDVFTLLTAVIWVTSEVVPFQRVAKNFSEIVRCFLGCLEITADEVIS